MLTDGTRGKTWLSQHLGYLREELTGSPSWGLHFIPAHNPYNRGLHTSWTACKLFLLSQIQVKWRCNYSPANGKIHRCKKRRDSTTIHWDAQQVKQHLNIIPFLLIRRVLNHEEYLKIYYITNIAKKTPLWVLKNFILSLGKIPLLLLYLCLQKNRYSRSIHILPFLF